MNINEIARKQFIGEPTEPDVTFYDHAVRDKALSEEKGRPVHREETWLLIKPTDPELVVKDARSLRAKEQHKRQFPEAWAKYQEGKKERQGRPVALLSSVSLAVQADLAAIGVYTIEQLAELDPVKVAAFIAERGNYAEADPEARAELKETVTRAVSTLLDDFAEQIKEARRYASTEDVRQSQFGSDRGVVQGEDRREVVESLQSRPAFDGLPSFTYSWTAQGV